MHAEEQLTKVRGHIDSHLDHGWEYERDADGNLVLDDEFEPVRSRSLITVKSLVDLARESRHAIEGEAPAVQVNNVNSASVRSVQTAPRTVSPGRSVLDEIEDAEIVSEEPEESAL